MAPVLERIDGVIESLLGEKEQEAKMKNLCVSEMNEVELALEETTTKKQRLDIKKGRLTSAQTGLTGTEEGAEGRIVLLEKEMQELQDSRLPAKEARAKEKEIFSKAVRNQ